MKILVTGGAGFMGSNFVRYILNKYPDYSVINFDKLTYAGNKENLADLTGNPHYSFVQGDIANEVQVGKVMPGVDVIVNYAAETHVDRSIMNPRDFLLTDVIGTYTLLEACRKNGIQKYIQISTDEVFGSIAKGKFTEKSPFEPNSPYSASKAGGDHLVRAHQVTYYVPTIVTHSCNFYGPYQYPEKLIPLFITNLLEGKKVPLYGDGKNIREWIYTEDHCSAIDFILHHGAIGEVYNIGTGNEKTNFEITQLLLKILEKGEEMIQYVKDRAGHDRRYAIDNSKLLALGWQPQVDFKEGLVKTAEWYKNNQAWWQKIKSGEYLKYYQEQYHKR